MILVLSNVANDAAAGLVGMFPPGAASLVTASDFNTSFKAGVSVGDFPRSELTIGGTRTTAGEISGVISTISHFLPQEFYYIEPEDRAYVCAELGAFMIYFLSELRCRKLNPQTARRLSGLGMHWIEWSRAAEARGVPVLPARLRNGTPVAGPDSRELRYLRATIIGDSIVGDNAPESIAGHMRALSGAFSMPYLSCLFASPGGDDYLLADLASVPDVSTQGNREAMVRYLGKES